MNRACQGAFIVLLSWATLGEAQDEFASTSARDPRLAEETLADSHEGVDLLAPPDVDVPDAQVATEGVPTPVDLEATGESDAPLEPASDASDQAVGANAESVENSPPVLGVEIQQSDPHTLDRSRERWRPWFSGIVHLSLLSDRLAVSTLNIRFGYGINAGARRGAWGVYGHLEQNLYAETEFDFVPRAGTLNMAVGGERFLFRERLRMAAAIGVSVLLTDLALHSTGHTGLFLQLKPAGIRFARESQVVVQLDVLSISIAAPVLGSPSVVDLQYRTTLAIEWQGQH